MNFEEYFEDVIGVSVPKDVEIQKVILKIDSDLWPYIKTKPLHGSQRIKDETNEYTIIQLELKPNYELEALILSYGEKIEVLQPEYFRNLIKHRINQCQNKYI